MLDFFGKRYYLILFVFIILSIAILTIHSREGDNGPIHQAKRLVLMVTSPLQAKVTGALTPIKDGWDYLIHFGILKRENRALKRELGDLRREVFDLRNMRRENQRLRRLLNFPDRKKFETITARVVGMPVSNWWSSVIIDRGSKDGVKPNMPVIADACLAGQVAEVTKNASSIILLNDSRSGVSVRIQRTGELGVIRGQSKEQKLSLRYISRNSSVRKGDIVVTSGLGGIFPKDIYVGKVTKVRESIYSLYKIIEVEAPINFADVEEVLVIKRVLKPDEASLFEEEN